MYINIKKLALFCWAMSLLITPCSLYSWGGYEECHYHIPCEPYTGPLNEARWSFTLKGGMAPTHWNKREKSYVIGDFEPSLLLSFGKGPSYKEMSSTPWLIGVEANYNLTEYIQTFVEFVYSSASARNYYISKHGITLHYKFDHMRSLGWFCGARYYFDRLCDRISPFFGLKVGFANQQQVDFTLKILDEKVKSMYFLGRNAVTAGIQLGFDIAIWDSFYGQVLCEFVGEQGLKGVHRIHIPKAPAGVADFSVGSAQTALSFPITIGLRYEY